MGAGKSWLAVEGIKLVGRFEQDPAVVLDSLPALPEHHSRHRGSQIVVADVLGRDASDLVEGFDMAFQECLLRLRRKYPVDCAARSGQTEDEHVAFRFHTVQDDPDFTEIHLGFCTWCVFLRDEHLNPAPCLQINLGPADPDIIPNR